MENIKLGDSYLSKEESKYLIEVLAKKRNVKNYKSKSSDKLYKIFKKQSKSKKRIDDIRDELKDPKYNISRSESKEIKRNLYNIEKRNKIVSKKTKRYLDELDERIRGLDKYHDYDDYEYRGIRDIKYLFKLSIDKDYYKAILTKSGYNGNYVQYESQGDKILIPKEYLALIEKYLRELINYYKNKSEWKVQLTAEINFISLKPGSDETRIMHSRSDNKEFMNGVDTEEIIKGLFESFLQKYEENLQGKMKGSDFEFDFYKISLNRGRSYIDSPQRLKDKKSTISPINNDYKCFQYAVTLALNLDKIRKNPQRTSKIKPFIDQYNWKDIDFLSTSKDWKKFELNNEIALNILYVPHNTRKIHVAYKLKHNITCDKQVILLMISNGENWHCLTAKSLPVLLRGITSNHKEDFYCLNCFRSRRTKNKLEAHKKINKYHNCCNVEMPTKDNNIIKYNQGEKSIKLPFVVYADLECLLEKMSTFQNNPNESSTTEINKHTPSGYSIFTHCSFDQTKKKLNHYTGKDCMKKFCKDLREHTTKIFNNKTKQMIPLTIKEKRHYSEQEVCYICKKEFDKNNKKYYKVRNHCHYTGKYRGAAHDSSVSQWIYL